MELALDLAKSSEDCEAAPMEWINDCAREREL